jgi:hypothetical protein
MMKMIYDIVQSLFSFRLGVIECELRDEEVTS